MTKYNELETKSNRSIKRVGRGISGGQGKTAGRGTKGQKSRSGSKKMSPVFMGGQLPLVKSTPKSRGFLSLRTPAQVVYLDHLNAFKGQIVDNKALFNAGYIDSAYQAVKIIKRGELTEKITLQVAGVSASVKTAIEKAGGSFIKTNVPLKMAKQKNTTTKSAK